MITFVASGTIGIPVTYDVQHKKMLECAHSFFFHFKVPVERCLTLITTEEHSIYLEKQLHPLEFGLLAVSMSVDGIVSGVFAADLPVTGGQIFFASFAVGMAAMYAGTAIGKKTGQKNGGNGALFGGILFYLLAFLKLT